MISLTFLGVRGSTPAVGEQFLRYGGHTSCIAVTLGDETAPTLILDAGTGIRDLPGVFAGTILLSHLHWDHVQGLPFSDALLSPLAQVEVRVPVPDGYGSALEALSNGFGPPSFPVRPDELGVGWGFVPLESADTVEGARVRTAPIRHKGGLTVGIRVAYGGATIVYMPDHDLIAPDPIALRLARGADLLIHDGQYVADDIETYRSFGHSSVGKALAFADEAGVGELIVTHHAPQRTDAELDVMAEAVDATPGGVPVTFAVQGMTVDVGVGYPVSR